jgi:hypothetical protein
LGQIDKTSDELAREFQESRGKLKKQLELFDAYAAIASLR